MEYCYYDFIIYLFNTIFTFCLDDWKDDVRKQFTFLSQCPDYFLQVSDGHNENICINNHKIGNNFNKSMDGAWREMVIEIRFI